MATECLNITTINYVYIRNEETQETLRLIVSIQYDARFSANDINTWEQYVSVKLQ